MLRVHNFQALETLTNNYETSELRPRHLLKQENTQRRITAVRYINLRGKYTATGINKPGQPSDCNEKVTYGLLKKKKADKLHHFHVKYFLQPLQTDRQWERLQFLQK